MTSLVCFAALGLTGCADSEEAVEEGSAPPAPVALETPSEPIAYVEYLQCKFGENYNAESFGPYLAAWNAEVDAMTDRNLNAFGYLPNEWSSDAFDGVWVLRWNDKESRDAGWKEYEKSGAADRSREEYPGIIECGPNEELDLFAFNAYSQKSPTKAWTQQNPPYAATMQFCSMTDGRPPTDLREHVTNEFLPYLTASEARIEDSTYWYQVAFMDSETSTGEPSTASGAFDFVWMNFWETLEQQAESKADWSEHGAAVQAKFNELMQCGDEIPYRGHYFRTVASS